MASTFGLRCWGARGSLPRLGPNQTQHGGNTVCFEVLHPGEERLILDAGTGIANLGDRILGESPAGSSIHLFISHYHWDHIMGLPFFGPIYRKGFTTNLYGLRSSEGHLRDMLEVVFSSYYSPIYSPDNLGGGLNIPDPISPIEIDDTIVTMTELPQVHPGGYMVTRIEHGGTSVAYASDVELREPSVIEAVTSCVSGCDVLICNAAFSQQRFERAVGWGHSSLEVAVDLARDAGVGRFIGVHYDIMRTDDELSRVLERQRKRAPELQIELAREGEELWLA